MRFVRVIQDIADVQAHRIPYLAGFGPDYSLKPALTLGGSKTMSRVMAATAATPNADYYSPSNISPGRISVKATCTAYKWTRRQAEESFLSKAKKDMRRTLSYGSVLGVAWPREYRRVVNTAYDRFQRIYWHGHVGFTSLDLGEAILRQAAFITNMESIGWLKTSKWCLEDPENQFPLQKAIARYRTFAEFGLRCRCFPRPHGRPPKQVPFSHAGYV